MRLLALLLAAVAALALASCGPKPGGGDDTPTQTQPPPTPTVKSTTNEVVQLLDDWTTRLIPPYRLMRRRTLAYLRRQPKVARRIEPELAEALLPLESWASEAKDAVRDLPPTKPVRMAIETGNAWSDWARTFRLGLRRGFNPQSSQALVVKQRRAFQLQVKTYVVSARPLPDAYQRPPLGLSAKQRAEFRRHQREAERRKAARKKHSRKK